jgi:hypothetical protein
MTMGTYSLGRTLTPGTLSPWLKSLSKKFPTRAKKA